MNPTDYEYLSNFLIGTSGLSLGAGKEYLLEARLIPLAQSLGMDGIPELVVELQKKHDLRVSSAVTEAMTTNETSFFRDKSPFEELKTLLLPDMLTPRATTRSLRIWCAAAATGQEPYTLMMTLRESFPQLRDWNIELLATDICQAALERAKKGVYSQFEVQRGLPVQMLMKYFDQVDEGWQVKEELGKCINWQQINLLDDFGRFGMFDIVFCRNVLIYFQNETKSHILDRIAKMLKTDGYLVLGAAETVLGISKEFERNHDCKAAVYRPASAVTV